jgi:hypothetical protein
MVRQLRLGGQSIRVAWGATARASSARPATAAAFSIPNQSAWTTAGFGAGFASWVPQTLDVRHHIQLGRFAEVFGGGEPVSEGVQLRMEFSMVDVDYVPVAQGDHVRSGGADIDAGELRRRREL